MLRPYSQLKQEVYLAPTQSVRANLYSIKTFIIAFILFFFLCLIISFTLHVVAHYGLNIRFQSTSTVNILNPLTFSVVLSTITGFIVLIKSSILRKVTFNFPMIKAFQPKK
ncbi:MAG TPA: hypothetical protein DIC42_00570 [Holosporales bacterium]|nr:hypothetical protein [Holosporales bacterium]